MTLKKYLTTCFLAISFLFSSQSQAETQSTPLILEGALVFNCEGYVYLDLLNGNASSTFDMPNTPTTYPDAHVLINGALCFNTTVYYAPGSSLDFPTTMYNYFIFQFADIHSGITLCSLQFCYGSDVSFCPGETMDVQITFPSDFGVIQGNNLVVTRVVPRGAIFKAKAS